MKNQQPTEPIKPTPSPASPPTPKRPTTSEDDDYQPDESDRLDGYWPARSMLDD